jgi:hypothetical protein
MPDGSVPDAAAEVAQKAAAAALAWAEHAVTSG